MSFHKQTEIRKVQAGSDSSFYIVFPRQFVNELKITRGDYLRWNLVGDSLIVRKAAFKEENNDEELNSSNHYHLTNTKQNKTKKKELQPQ